MAFNFSSGGVQTSADAAECVPLITSYYFNGMMTCPFEKYTQHFFKKLNLAIAHHIHQTHWTYLVYLIRDIRWQKTLLLGISKSQRKFLNILQKKKKFYYIYWENHRWDFCFLCIKNNAMPFQCSNRLLEVLLQLE